MSRVSAKRAVVVACFVLPIGCAAHPAIGPRGESPQYFPIHFTDRKAIQDQSEPLPKPVEVLLAPSLGSPARLDSTVKTFTAITLSYRPEADKFFLVPRDVLRKALHGSVRTGSEIAPETTSCYYLQPQTPAQLAFWRAVEPVVRELERFTDGDPFGRADDYASFRAAATQTGMKNLPSVSELHAACVVKVIEKANEFLANSPSAPDEAAAVFLSYFTTWLNRAPNHAGFHDSHARSDVEDDYYEDIRRIFKWRNTLAKAIWDGRDELRGFERVNAVAARDSREEVQGVFDAVHANLAAAAEDESVLVPLEIERSFSVGAAIGVELRPPGNVPAGLYGLIQKHAGGVDSQWNAVYVLKPSAGADFDFVAAGDIQFGTRERVLKATLRFVDEVNSLVQAPTATGNSVEFVVLAGDVVDCNYASARHRTDIPFKTAEPYVTDYLQAWLVLAELELPVYLVPGNHDGYRFENFFTHGTQVDGLRLFENVFGPTYHSFDRGHFRFICLNSYDLPDELRSLHRGGPSLSWAELAHYDVGFVDRLTAIAGGVVRKANKLNWGGGIQKPQLSWLQTQLATTEGKSPLVFMHHDPRGATPQIRPDWAPAGGIWGVERHFPLMRDVGKGGRQSVVRRFQDLRSRRSGYAPRFSQTVTAHRGFYTPLRLRLSDIKPLDWFETFPPPPCGSYPGWLRFQQEWHLPVAYPEHWPNLFHSTPAVRYPSEDFESPDEAQELAHPLDVLRVLVEGRTAAIFKAHDNLFSKDVLLPGTDDRRPATILGVWTKGEELGLVPFDDAESLRLLRPLSIYNVADIADAESDGHGWLRVSVRGNEIAEQEHDLPGVERDQPEDGW